MYENEPRYNETWSERTDILPISWPFVLLQPRCFRLLLQVSANEGKKRASSEKACKRKKTAERGEPVSVFTNTSVRLLAEKPLLMSEWQMLNVKVCSAGGFYTLAYSACAKPRRNCNKNVFSKVNLRSSSLYRDYSYPLTLSNEGELS